MDNIKVFKKSRELQSVATTEIQSLIWGYNIYSRTVTHVSNIAHGPLV